MNYDVAIVGGCGHIGLPFGLVLADAGLDVVLIDVDKSRRDAVASGRMPFMERNADEILTRVIGRTLHVIDDLSAIAGARHIVLTIGTPVDEYLNPRLMPIISLFEKMREWLKPDQHVMLRSTVFPGTTNRIAQIFREWGTDLNLSFCPERITQGNAIDEIGAFPQLISGTSSVAVAAAHEIFTRIKVPTIETSVLESELAKLFTNAFRYVQFGIVNQFYMVAEQHGVSFDNIYRAMTSDYQRLAGLPRPGFAAGPCLFKDTMQLAAFSPESFQLGQAAMRANEGLPQFLVEQLVRNHGINLVGHPVGVLGMTFKSECDDIRDALSFKLTKLLRFQGANVFCSDEYFEEPSFLTKEELVERSSVIFVGVPHKAYRKLQIPKGKIVIDLWGILGA